MRLLGFRFTALRNGKAIGYIITAAIRHCKISQAWKNNEINRIEKGVNYDYPKAVGALNNGGLQAEIRQQMLDRIRLVNKFNRN